jgi:hypothetical protein
MSLVSLGNKAEPFQCLLVRLLRSSYQTICSCFSGEIGPLDVLDLTVVPTLDQLIEQVTTGRSVDPTSRCQSFNNAGDFGPVAFSRAHWKQICG